MPAQLFDTQQGATMSFATDGLSLRLMEIPPILKEIVMIRCTHLQSTKHQYVPGELPDYPEVRIRFQNSPTLASLTQVSQTVTITGPVPPGGSTAEIFAGTAVVRVVPETPGYSAENEALQMKEAVIKFDGQTGPTRTPAS